MASIHKVETIRVVAKRGDSSHDQLQEDRFSKELISARKSGKVTVEKLPEEIDSKCKHLTLSPQSNCDEAARKDQQFPDELVDMVIARMPFPALFKARCLSRNWYFKFPRPSSSIKSISPFFQEEIASVSKRWPSVCPVIVSNQEILAFIKDSNQWRSVVNLSSLWDPDSTRFVNLSLTSMGPLLCTIQNIGVDGDLYDIYIANVFTNTWKKLPDVGGPQVTTTPYIWGASHMRLLPLGTDGYRVLLICDAQRGDGVDTAMYDSRSRTWTSSQPPPESAIPRPQEFQLRSCSSAYVDEKLFCMFESKDGPMRELWVYDISNNSWVATPHRFTGYGGLRHAAVLRCGEKLMVSVWAVTDYEYRGGLQHRYNACNSIIIYEIKRDTYNVEYLDTSPRNFIPGLPVDVSERKDGDQERVSHAVHLASDADFLCCNVPYFASFIVKFNVRTHEWSHIPQAPRASEGVYGNRWVDLAFEPGLNVFLEVRL